jgi:hypothetical protein
MSGVIAYIFANSGIIDLIVYKSSMTSELAIICISKSVTVKCSGSAVNICWYLSPKIIVPVSPFLYVILA